MRRSLLMILMTMLILVLFTVSAYTWVHSDITQFGSDVIVHKGEVERGNVTVFGGNATIDGTVTGDITVFGGNMTINGRIDGNATNFGGNTTLGNKAAIGGNFTHFGGQVSKSPGAVIKGTETAGFRSFNPFTNFLFNLFGLIGTLALAALVVALLPNQTAKLADTIESDPWLSLGLGFVATILIPVVFLVLAIILFVGWALIPLVAIAIPIIFFYAYVGASRWLGRRILGSAGPGSNTPIFQVLLGVLILGLIGFIPILGFLVRTIAALFGLGAVILSKFGTGRPWTRRRAATPPPEAEAGTKGAA